MLGYNYFQTLTTTIAMSIYIQTLWQVPIYKTRLFNILKVESSTVDDNYLLYYLGDCSAILWVQKQLFLNC